MGVDQNPDLWDKKITNLSGGWRRLLLIASAVLKDPDVLILDEPTNHLDLGKIFQLEEFLTKEIHIPYLLVSHDREFLDKCTTKTLFMRSDGLHEFSAPFSSARENLLQADALAYQIRDKEDAEIKRIEKAAKRLKEWGRRAPQSDLSKKGEALQTRANKIKENQTAVYKEEIRDINLHQDRITSKSILVSQNTWISTPDGTPLFKIKKVNIKYGERVCVLGLNGTGKSMFIKRLVQELHNYQPGPAHEKDFWFSPQVRLGYLDQHLDILPKSENPYSLLSRKFGLNRTQITRELVSTGFPIDQHGNSIGKMSSGEKARLSLLMLKLEKPNFYILDEPTNHLDIQGQELLEEELDNNDHTCIFVSHDRKLVSGASTRFLEIRNGELIEVDGPEQFYASLKGMNLGTNLNDKTRSQRSASHGPL